MAETSPKNSDMLDDRKRLVHLVSLAYALTIGIAPDNAGLAVKAETMEIQI